MSPSLSAEDARQRDSQHAQRLLSASLKASTPAAHKMLSERRDMMARAESLSRANKPTSTHDSAASEATSEATSELLIVHEHTSASSATPGRSDWTARIATPSVVHRATGTTIAAQRPAAARADAAAGPPPSMLRCLAEGRDGLAAIVLNVLGCGSGEWHRKNFLAHRM